MKKVLCMNAHPNTALKASVSNQLMASAKERLGQENDLEIIEWDIYDSYVPRIDREVMEMWNSLKNGSVLTERQKQIKARQDEIMALWKSIDIFVISMPLHNFNIPSALKDVLDTVLVAGETFQYTEAGPQGLMDGHQKIMLIQASGSEYQKEEQYRQIDYAPRYVKSAFAFMGMDDFRAIRAEGTALTDPVVIRDIYKEQMLTELDRMLV